MRGRFASVFLLALFVLFAVAAVRAGDAFLALMAGLAIGATVSSFVVDLALRKQGRIR